MQPVIFFYGYSANVLFFSFITLMHRSEFIDEDTRELEFALHSAQLHFGSEIFDVKAGSIPNPTILFHSSGGFHGIVFCQVWHDICFKLKITFTNLEVCSLNVALFQ